MENLFSYYEGSLSSLIDDACNNSGDLVKMVFCRVSEALITELERRGVKIDKNKRNQDVIIYTKTLNDFVVICAEEVRLGRKELAVSTLYIKKKGKLTDADR